MTHDPREESAVSDAVLWHAVEEALPGIRVAALARTDSAYSTSARLEEITVQLSDGTTRHLLLKHLGFAVRHPRAQRAKPPFVINPDREIAVYRYILTPHRLGARFVAASLEGAPSPWLLIEKVAGVEMYQLGDVSAWRAAARWIGNLQRRLAPARALVLPVGRHLLAFDRSFCTQWMNRALFFFGNDDPTSRQRRDILQALSRTFDRVIDRLLASPIAIIHGEFYASNILASYTDDTWHVWPIDWEMAAIGPAVMDVAALTSGDWSEAARANILEGYTEAYDSELSVDELTETVSYAQLYLAIQWLGWFGRRRAPAEHARDWLADAVKLAERLKL